MKRKQVTQIINLGMFPKLFKKLIAEFLSWFVLKVNASKPFLPVIEEILDKTQTKKVLNIEFNIGAGVETVKPFLKDDITIESISVTKFNTTEKGVYLFVNAFHQLQIFEAKKILHQIADSENPVVVVEGNNDNLWQIIGMTVFVPLTVLATAPFVKPFRISRIIFTYLIPILPIVIIIDGCISLLKLYNPSDLLELTASLNTKNYEWKAGKNDNGRGGKIIYLTGRKLQ